MIFKKWCWLMLLLYKCVAANWEFSANEEEVRVQFNHSISEGLNTHIQIDENIDERVVIAYFNYKGERDATLHYREPSKNGHEMLGALVEKGNKGWSLIVTKPQDYEDNNRPKRYVLEISTEIPKLTRNVYLWVNNIDDERPYIEVVENPCKINENKAGQSDCYYKLSDADGVLKNIMDYKIIGNKDEDQMFEFKNEIILNENVYEWVAYLSVKKCLDFETTALYLFEFMAIDSGGNNGTARIIVEVNDLPDQPPVWTDIFSSKRFDEKTPQEFQVKAVDGDVNVNYTINYDLNSDWPTLFSINRETGLIKVNGIDRDYLQQEIFSVELIAYEVPDPCWTTSQNVTMIVNDVNDNIPKIIINTTELWIPENTVAKIYIHINITDMDQGENGTYAVFLLDDESGHNYHEAFQIVPERGYHSMNFSISIVNHTKLDYEDLSWQNLTFNISSIEINTFEHWNDSKKIYIYLENLNDELPIFLQDEYTECVCENIGSDEYIATVYAEDRDIDDVVTHTLVGSISQALFKINAESGEIRTLKENAFDYETQTQVIIQVQAQDSLHGVHHTVIAQLTVDVKDVNDEQPQIKMSSGRISIEENQLNGTVYNPDVKILAQDEDTTARLKFRIDWDNSEARKDGQPVEAKEYKDSVIVDTQELGCGGYVKAVLLVNEIRKDNTPDYEEFDILYLQLIVEDEDQIIEPKTDEVRVIINIEDVNDNYPIFREETLNSTKRVTEHSPENTPIASVVADDADGPLYNIIKYSIKPYNDTTPDCVAIDEDLGELSVKCDIDADADETNNKPAYWGLLYAVSAASQDLVTTNLTMINITDINDNDPVVRKLDLIVHILENAENDTQVQIIDVFDGDRDDPYNKPWFRLSQHTGNDVQNLFSVETHTGRVCVHFKNDHEFNRDFGAKNYTIQITISDNYDAKGPGGIQRTIPDVSFVLVLDDINNQYPHINNDHRNVTTSEKLKKGETIKETVLAQDFDEPGTPASEIAFKVVYVEAVEASNKELPKDFFLFDVTTDAEHKTGIGYVTAQADLRGYYGLYKIGLVLNDFGDNPEPLYNDDEIFVYIERHNFEPPTIMFPKEDEPIYLDAKDQKHGDELITYGGELLELFSATDNQGEKWDITLEIEKASNPDGIFTLRPKGKSKFYLTLLKDPNYFTTYNLIIKADCNCDEDESLRASTVSTNIRFISVDSEPYFSINEIHRDFTENTTDETTILPKAYFNDQEEEWLNFTIYYHLDSDTSSCFELHKTERILSLKCVLDREEVGTHILKVVASRKSTGNRDPDAKSILTVNVTVLDINDNPPNFDQRMYQGSVKPSDKQNTIILTATATDLDLNDSMKFSMDNLLPHGNGLDAIPVPFIPFQSAEDAVDVLLNFSVQPTMNGYFTFDLIVTDEVDHSDTVPVHIFIVSESSRTPFTFDNKLDIVSPQREVIRNILEEQYQYNCTIEGIQRGVDETGKPVDTSTEVLAHFVNFVTNEPVEGAEIILISSTHEVYNPLRNKFLDKGLNLRGFTTGSNNNNNTSTVLLGWLIGAAVVLGTLCISLITAFIIKVRSLKRRLEKLSQTTFGSRESGLNRLGIAAPGTNKHAVEGSNPVWGEENNIPDIDRASIGSGDSDLIGIEDNPNFDYGSEKEGNVNPAFKGRY